MHSVSRKPEFAKIAIKEQFPKNKSLIYYLYGFLSTLSIKAFFYSLKKFKKTLLPQMEKQYLP